MGRKNRVILFLCAMLFLCCKEPDSKIKKTDTASGNYLQNRSPLNPCLILNFPWATYNQKIGSKNNYKLWHLALPEIWTAFTPKSWVRETVGWAAMAMGGNVARIGSMAFCHWRIFWTTKS